MLLFLNLGLAWISVALVLSLSSVYLLRKVGHSGIAGGMVKNLNKTLRRHHRVLGVLLILIGLIHGYYSSVEVLSWNLGTATWLLSVLLGCTFMLRRFLGRQPGWMSVHRLLTVVVIVALVLHLYDVGISAPTLLLARHGMVNAVVTEEGTAEPLSVNNSATSTLNKQFAGVKLRDGVYVGEANGFGPGLTVSVTIRRNEITKIVVTDHHERDARFYSRPIEQVPGEIISKQSLAVDTVAGATCTSIGIINAVNDALSQALLSGSLPNDLKLPR